MSADIAPVFTPDKWDGDTEPLGADVAPERDERDAGGLHCLVCGVPIVKTATRGPMPKYCDAHRAPNSRGGSVTGAPSTPKTGVSEATLTRINVGITTQVLTLGNVIRNVERFDGSVLVNNSEKIGQACEDVSRRDPKFRKACEDYLAKTGYIELSILALAVLTPIAMHHGIMPGRKLPAEFIAEVERKTIAHADDMLDTYNFRRATTGL